MISEEEAIAVVDKVPAGLVAKDAAGIVALYSDDAVLVDIAAPGLITTKEANLAATTDFVSGDITKAVVNERKVQILDADTFVVTEIVTVDMKPGGKAQQATVRVTDVVQKKADGSWTIVNEHVSAMPQMPKTPLPVVATFPPQ
jgi:uncharacterized protein (TIGR02246 family)